VQKNCRKPRAGSKKRFLVKLKSIAYLGIGSNIGKREENLTEAVLRVNAADRISVIQRSSYYKTLPVGGPPQEDYLNGVIKVETDLSPDECLSALKQVEKDMGRKPAGKNHPRIIDLDILLYEDTVTDTETLSIPHPRMHERYFVLRGLAEIAPEVMHPVLKKTMKELYETLREDAADRKDQ